MKLLLFDVVVFYLFANKTNQRLMNGVFDFACIYLLRENQFVTT